MAVQTAREQLMLELINRARLDPQGEADRFGIGLNDNLAPGTLDGTAKTPLAMNGFLVDSSLGHSQWMIDNDVFSHTGSGNSSAGDRMAAAGYSFTGGWSWGENIAWQGTTGTPDLTAYIYAQHQGLFESAGHRTNILGDQFLEIGLGQIAGPFTYNGTTYNASMITQNFANSGSNYFITGVAFDDSDGDNFYSVGEARSGVSIVTSAGSTSSNSAGGYSQSVVAGNYDVTFSGGGLINSITVTVDVSAGNAKLDVIDGTTIWSSASLTLGNGATTVELLGVADLNVTGSGAAESITGNKGANTINGNGGNDIINGRAGADTMNGGAGNDTIFVDNTGDVVVEAVGEGTNDRVATNISYALTAGAEVELFTTTSSGSTAALNLTGNTLAQTIIGNAGNNFLKGGGSGGADTFQGLGGDDKYRVYNSADTIIEGTGQGNDRVFTSVDYTLGAGVEIETFTTNSSSGTANLNLTGNELAQTIIGNAGNNVISDGVGSGADLLRGLGGDDTYIVRNANTTIIESASQGANDRVATSMDYTLGAAVNVELLTTTSSGGTAAIDLTGNELAQTIIGNAGDNFLKGGGVGGADTMRGLGGDDKYRVYNAGDTIIENSGQGNDRVYTSVDYQLGAGVEIETFTTNSSSGTANLNLTGNTLAQTIIGNAGDNFLKGGGVGGGDTMRGLGGDDKYRLYNSADTIIENSGQGNDRAYTSVDYQLGAGVEIETFTTNSSSGTTNLNLTGNELAQLIIGNAGNNQIDGKDGSDTLRGLGGSDTFAFTSALGIGNVDTILDFNVADDTISLDDSIFTALSTGTLAASAFRANTTGLAQDATDRIIYDTSNGNLLYDADGTGAGASIQFADLTAGLGLNNNDFDVV